MNIIFDKTIIESLRDLEKQTGQNIVSEMISEFMVDAGKSVQEMKQKVGQSLFSDIAAIAHSLKSSSANVGALYLSELCEKIECHIVKEKSQDHEKLKKLIEEAEQTLPPTLELLKCA